LVKVDERAALADAVVDSVERLERKRALLGTLVRYASQMTKSA
jgi:hypothetical protein